MHRFSINSVWLVDYSGQWAVVDSVTLSEELWTKMTTPRFHFTRNHETARHTYEEYIKDRAVDIQACLEVRRTIRLEGETQVLVTIHACGNCAECVRRGIMPARTVVYRDWGIRVGSWITRATSDCIQHESERLESVVSDNELKQNDRLLFSKWKVSNDEINLIAFCLEQKNSLMLLSTSCVCVNIVPNVPAPSVRDPCQERC